MRMTLLLVGAAILASCSRPAPPGVAGAAKTRYNTEIPLNEVMVHAINPAAFQFWSGSGESYSKGRVVDLSPQTAAAWKSVEDGAAMIVISTNTLKLSPYARAPIADWNRHADEVAAVAMRGKAAAERQDRTAVAEIGEALDEACEGCHRQFEPNARRP